ncbi:unnamed protein product [Prorocentrum cordatum]|uniref:Hydantoin racemase n=1 Tax=Prorocentrum cordatum TaxID=2364126 RepID=A0ABN9XBL4_9DINO|nr:unnamed protein product [Polarella glacialis]|mmetsp:Transcript_82397/g.233171  ORF Transcript_82397/g.233171 Transcript_82397/m.233171 type:complete len:276 (+) Transcript_82397:69-896(+)
MRSSVRHLRLAAASVVTLPFTPSPANCTDRAPAKPRILVVNPNSSSSFTELMAARAKGWPQLDAVCINPATGPASIEGDFDDVLSAVPTLEEILRRRGTFDAVVVACISDHSAIAAAREALVQPVVGILEASVMLACLVGEKFAIVTSNRRWEPLLWRALETYGVKERCCGVRGCLDRVLDLEGDVHAMILQTARELVEQGAEVIVLGCAGMAGLKEDLEAQLHVPVVDPIDAGFAVAGALVTMRLATSKVNTYHTPGYKACPNISPLLQSAYKN